MGLPTEFVSQMQKLLGADYQAFKESLNQATPTSIRRNRPKTSPADYEGLDSVAWCDSAYYLKERPTFTLYPSFHAGAYYVQEASSMFTLFAVKRWLKNLEMPLKILDLCAAPGGKSTLLRELGDQHLIISNEVIKARYRILKENLTKWGATNIITTNHDVKDFQALTGFFDVVLVDAPCSGEGLFRKDPKSRSEWSLNNVQLCTVRQKRILASAAELVAEDGLLIYSTCTYNSSENIGNVDWLAGEMSLRSLKLDFDQEMPCSEITGVHATGYQFFPHRARGEGFFIAGFRKITLEKTSKRSKRNMQLDFASKKEQELLKKTIKFSDSQQVIKIKNELRLVSKYWIETMAVIKSTFTRSEVGLPLGEIKQDTLVPHHALALAYEVKLGYPVIDLEKLEALKYLKGESFGHDSKDRGWHLVKYTSHNLGWCKVLPNRVNNYYPKPYRIRMQIPS